MEEYLTDDQESDIMNLGEGALGQVNFGWLNENNIEQYYLLGEGKRQVLTNEE